MSQAVRDIVRFAVETNGRLDVLMNNAYWNQLGSALKLFEEDWGPIDGRDAQGAVPRLPGGDPAHG